MNTYRLAVQSYRRSIEALKAAETMAAPHYSKLPADFDNWKEVDQDAFFTTSGAHDTEISARFGIPAAIRAMHAAREAMFTLGLSIIQSLPQYAAHAAEIERTVKAFGILSAKNQDRLLKIFLDFDGKPYRAKVSA